MIPLVKAKLVGLGGKISGAIQKIKLPTLAKGGVIAGAGYLGAIGITEADRTIKTIGEGTREVIKEAREDIKGMGAFFWIIVVIMGIVGVIFVLLNLSDKKIRRRKRRLNKI